MVGAGRDRRGEPDHDLLVKGAWPSAKHARAFVTDVRSDAGARLPPELEQAVSHFNGRRYIQADGAWRRAMLRAPEAERAFLEGLRLVTWGLYYVDRRNYRPARRELAAGLDQLVRFPAGHLGMALDEVIDLGLRLLWQLNEGGAAYLIPPVIKRARTQIDTVAEDPSGAGR